MGPQDDRDEPPEQRFERLLAEFENKGPCAFCASLKDCCPLCSAEIGRILGAGLAAAGFVPLDIMPNLPRDSAN